MVVVNKIENEIGLVEQHSAKPEAFDSRQFWVRVPLLSI